MVSIVAERYAQALYQLTAEVDEPSLGQAVRAFVLLLKKRSLLSKIEMIIEAFHRCVRKEDDRRRLRLIVARSLGDETQKKLASHDRRWREARVEVDSSIIGGVIMRDKSLIIDASVKRQCQELQHRLSQ